MGIDNLPVALSVIRPELIRFVSYPYEWCFSQLQDAALTTLKIQKLALEFGMSLKDASAYNIQFHSGRPILIDTLSFEKLPQGKPWIAYRQYCQHFLAPLLLMAYKDIRLSQFLKVYIDGIPLDFASRTLPWFTRFIPSIFLHVHMHALSQKHYASKQADIRARKISRNALIGIIDSLSKATTRIKIRLKKSEWGESYRDTNYSPEAFADKQELVRRFIQLVKPKQVWDLGANTGVFSRIASKTGIPVIAFDVDAMAVERNYRECLANKKNNILPLLLDLTNPSPGIGWENRERKAWIDRGPADMLISLALIHHLAISNNVPFERIAALFKRLCHSLIIEFIPKRDSQVQRLLATREDIFNSYTQPVFEKEFGRHFSILALEKIKDSERTLYLMKAK